MVQNLELPVQSFLEPPVQSFQWSACARCPSLLRLITCGHSAQESLVRHMCVVMVCQAHLQSFSLEAHALVKMEMTMFQSMQEQGGYKMAGSE